MQYLQRVSESCISPVIKKRKHIAESPLDFKGSQIFAELTGGTGSALKETKVGFIASAMIYDFLRK